MNLLLDCIPEDQGRSGISVYINQVVNHLVTQGHTLTLIVEYGRSSAYPNLTCIEAPRYTQRAVCAMLWHLLLLPRLLRRLPERYDRFIILAANRRMPASSPFPTSAVVHDLSQYHIKGKYDPLRLLYIKHILPWATRRTVEDCIAISQSTANDLVTFWKIPQDRIRVVYNGIDRDHLPLASNQGTGNTVLYVSRLEHPGKNHVRLIEAWERLPATLHQTYQLLIVGADWPGAEHIHQRIASSPARDSIQTLGFVTQQQLHDLYQQCRLFIFPSLFEGFGLGLLEAMACGAVCATSKTSSLGELAGDAAITFDPYDIAEMTQALITGLTDDATRQTLRERAIPHAHQFNWATTAQQLISAPTPAPRRLMGIPYFTGTMDEALTQIDNTVSHFHAHPNTPSKCAYFMNADCFNQAYTSIEYYQLITKHADIVWADGVGIAWAARYLKDPVAGNVNGTDMLPFLCQRGIRLFLFGGQPRIAEQAQQRLEQRFPNTQIVGTHHGFINQEETLSLIDTINQAKPDILLVAMGVPIQERWMQAHRQDLHIPLLIGVGGLLDFASEHIPRAPQLMRKMKLEWLFRLSQEPIRLFKRYVIGNPLFIYRTLICKTQSPFNDKSNPYK